MSGVKEHQIILEVEWYVIYFSPVRIFCSIKLFYLAAQERMMLLTRRWSSAWWMLQFVSNERWQRWVDEADNCQMSDARGGGVTARGAGPGPPNTCGAQISEHLTQSRCHLLRKSILYIDPLMFTQTRTLTLSDICWSLVALVALEVSGESGDRCGPDVIAWPVSSWLVPGAPGHVNTPTQHSGSETGSGSGDSRDGGETK